MKLSYSDAAGVLNPSDKSIAVKAVFVLVGTGALALASQIAVPMVPVPITMQTFAVTMIGALYGWRLGALTVAAWLFEAAIGLPVLANGTGGVAPFVGPTAGYLTSFPVVAALAGWLTAKGWDARKPIRAFLAHFSANLLCLAIGGTWLAYLIGPEKAWLLGVLPFLVGAVLKSALAAACLKVFGVDIRLR